VSKDPHPGLHQKRRQPRPHLDALVEQCGERVRARGGGAQRARARAAAAPGRQVPALARQRRQLRCEARLLPAGLTRFSARVDTPSRQVPALARQRRQLRREARLLPAGSATMQARGHKLPTSSSRQASMPASALPTCQARLAVPGSNSRTWHSPRAPAPLPAPTTLQPVLFNWHTSSPQLPYYRLHSSGAHLADCSRANAAASSPAWRSSSAMRAALAAGASAAAAAALSAATAAAVASCAAGSASCGPQGELFRFI